MSEGTPGVVGRRECPHCGKYYYHGWPRSMNENGEWIGRCVVCGRAFVVSKGADE